MGDVIQFRTAVHSGGATSPPPLDALTVEVATAIWRLGGEGSIAEIAQSLARGRGRMETLNDLDIRTLAAAITARIEARAHSGRAALFQRSGEGWALTDVANAILGVRPCL